MVDGELTDAELDALQIDTRVNCDPAQNPAMAQRERSDTTADPGAVLRGLVKEILDLPREAKCECGVVSGKCWFCRATDAVDRWEEWDIAEYEQYEYEDLNG